MQQVSLHIVLGFFGWLEEECNTSITKSQRSTAGIPSMRRPASREVISDSHIQRIGANVWLPKMHKIPPDVDFESSKSPAKSESWNNPNLHCCAVFPTWQHCLNSHVWWMYEIKRAKRLSQALVHLVTARATVFTDHKISGPPMRAKYMHFRTIWAHTFDNSPTDPINSSLKWWSSTHGVATLSYCRVVLSANSLILITASLSSKMYNKASWREELTFEEVKSILFRSSIFPWIFFRVGDLYRSPRTWLFWCVFPWRTVTIRSHKSSAGKPANLNPASKDMISDSVCWTVRNWSLLLTHPTDWNKCTTSQCSTKK